MRLAKTVFACLWREVYVVACLRQLGSSVKCPQTPTGCVCVCDVKTHGRHWRVYLNDIAISLQFNVSFLKPTCTAVSAEELSASIYLRMTTLNSILFFHMLSKRVFL